MNQCFCLFFWLHIKIMAGKRLWGEPSNMSHIIIDDVWLIFPILVVFITIWHPHTALKKPTWLEWNNWPFSLLRLFYRRLAELYLLLYSCLLCVFWPRADLMISQMHHFIIYNQPSRAQVLWFSTIAHARAPIRWPDLTKWPCRCCLAL